MTDENLAEKRAWPCASSQLVALLVCIAIGCAGQAPDAARETQRLPSLSEYAVIGCDACDGPEQFGDLNSVAVDSTGRVYIVDTYEPFVRVFEADGAFVGEFGGRGEGPGESMVPGWAFADTATTMVLFNRLPARLQKLSLSDGEDETVSEESWTIPGGLYLAADRFPTSRYVYFFSPMGRQDGAMSLERWDLAEERRESVSTGGEYEAKDVAIAAGPGNGVAIVRRSHSEIDFLTEDGSLASTIGPLREHDNSEVGTSPPGYTGRFGIQFDDEGLLWVMRTSDDDQAATTFQIIGTDKQWLGEVVVPAKIHRFVRSFDVSGMYLAAITLREQQYVSVWRVHR